MQIMSVKKSVEDREAININKGGESRDLLTPEELASKYPPRASADDEPNTYEGSGSSPLSVKTQDEIDVELPSSDETDETIGTIDADDINPDVEKTPSQSHSENSSDYNLNKETVAVFASMYKAVMVFPGFHDNALALSAVQKIAQYSRDIADEVGDSGESLAVNHPLYCAMVSDAWVNALFEDRGASSSRLPIIDTSVIANAIKSVNASKALDRPFTAPPNHQSHSAFIRTAAKITSSIYIYQNFISAATENRFKTNVSWCVDELLYRLKESVQGLTATTEIDTDECHAALYDAAGGFFEVLWGDWRSRIYENIKAMEGPVDAVQYLSSEQFQQGFPLQALARDWQDGIRQLALSVLRTIQIKARG